MPDEPPEMQGLLAQAAAGDRAAWGALLAAHQERLARMVAFRMDDRLRGRIDASDVVQDALLAASANGVHYFRTPDAPLFLWLRGVIMNKLLELRARAQQALGDRWSPAAFHDLVLTGGDMPLMLLERRVDEWIAREKGA